MSARVSDTCLKQLFLDARTHTKWQAREVPDALLIELIDTMKMGPTSANTLPARVVFVKSPAAKARLKPHLQAGNVEKTMRAPVTAIIGHDLQFYDNLDRAFPHDKTVRGWFAGKPDHIATTAFRNGSLQGAYLILAARALGLDCGPMSGFDNAGVDAEFFAGTSIKSNFLVNLGYGDPAGLYPRSPRLAFADIGTII